MLKLFHPSFYGDILLEPHSEKETKLSAVKLSESEKGVLAKLLEHARKKGWTETASLEGGGDLVLKAPIEKVSLVLAKILKPGRRTLTAVRVENGRLTEVDARSFAEVVEESKTKKVAAASVAVPARGCPMPAFNAAEVAATRVLLEFLTPEQAEDFRREQAFVSVGADTGHRYVVSSRLASGRRFTAGWRGGAAERTGGLVAGLPFDLDEGRSLCVHDWDVPAAEECLAVHACLSLPGMEGYLRTLPPEHGGPALGVSGFLRA